MSSQIRPSVTNPTVAAIYKEINDGMIVLAPEFQRKFVWTQEHQEKFIETILRGLPFPEIYVSSGSVDVENMRTTRNVIDGQQRLTTIKNYIEGRFDRPLQTIKYYKDLTQDEKSQFLVYELVVRDLGKIDDDVVREIFRRINLTKFKLDAVEIHNAIYDGAFIKCAKGILDSIDLSVFGVFKESEFTRMSDLHFILTVMATIESGGYFLQDTPVEGFIERYNETYENENETSRRILGALNFIGKIALPPDSMWFRKANFFTMVVELAWNKETIPADLRARMLSLEESVMANKLKPESDFGRYYSYMYQNTNGRIARVTRGEMFRSRCIASIVKDLEL